MRDVRGDFVSLVAVLVVPLAFALAFPREAVVFVGSDRGARATDPSASIVFLGPSAVAKAMRATKILQRSEGNGRFFADLLFVDLPDADLSPVLAIEARHRPSAPAVVERGVPPFLPSRRAAAPVRIPAEKDRDDLPFSRNELLKLN